MTRPTRGNVGGHCHDHGYMVLSHQRLLPGGVRGKPELIVIPRVFGYSMYYQKPAIDHVGRLYRRYHHHMVLISGVGGGNRRFAATSDFLAGIAEPDVPGTDSPEAE